MNNPGWRRTLLGVTCGGIIWSLGHSILVPIASHRSVPPFVFPTDVPLPGWQPLQSRSLATPVKDGNQMTGGRHYQYLHQDVPLDAEMHYLLNMEGDVSPHLQELGLVPASPTVVATHHQQQTDFYLLFTSHSKAYLSACINPQGGSTVTYTQFKHSQYVNGLTLNRLLLRLLGQASLSDDRCLWTLLSVPVKDAEPQAAYQTLAKAWVSWKPWWQQRFSQP